MTADPADVAVGVRIRLARLEAGLSQDAMGASIGVSFQQVQKYEKGVNRVSASKLTKISEATGKPVRWFFPDKSDPSADAADYDVVSQMVVGGGMKLARAFLKMPPETRVAFTKLAECWSV